MAILDLTDCTTPKSHKPERNLTMSKKCQNNSHVWTVETYSTTLTPALDLVPGRRCLCGVCVIIDPDPILPPNVQFPVVSITSKIALLWAVAHPDLKTW